jgi:inhibitor of KinA sporulation pathway (predicted exonuclease)
MIRDINKILCVDTEHSCYENNNFPQDEKSDIIQIGWCWLMLSDLSITTPQMLYVRPTRSQISSYCTNLTGIKPHQVMKAPILNDACQTLINKHGTKARPWMTWGFDMPGLKQECNELQANFPFSESYFNAQDLASIFLGLPLRTNLSKALNILNMTFEGKQHKATDDSYNLARIVREMLIQTNQNKNDVVN